MQLLVCSAKKRRCHTNHAGRSPDALFGADTNAPIGATRFPGPPAPSPHHLPMPEDARPSPSASPLNGKDLSQLLTTAHQLCESRGTRLTPIRRKVLEILLREQRSLKAYELLDLIRTIQPGAAPPTVYRALDFLVEQHLVHRLDAINAWAACMDAAGNHHDILVVCTRCGAVAELSDPALSRQLAERVAQSGFRLISSETELRAECSTCGKTQDVCSNSSAVL